MSSAIVLVIAAMPGMAERLLVAHADDGTGRCAVCSAGAQSGRYVWPCTLRTIALQATRCSRASASHVSGSVSRGDNRVRAISA